MAVNIDIIIKLGGSAITVKNDLETVKYPELGHATNLIKTCLGADLRCLVVHGAGSFGHHQAKEYGVNNGFKNEDIRYSSKVKEGFCKTRQSVLKLNHIVTNALVTAGVPAVSQSPCGRWTTQSDEVLEDDVSNLLKIIHNGFVPVTHGDCVFDTKQGCRILSGDTIIKVLCRKASVKRVVFLTDVPGVFDIPPHVQGATLLSCIKVTDTEEEFSPKIITSTSDKDVTGGVRLKVDSAVDIVRQSHGRILVFICQVGHEAALNACLEATLKEEPGTVVFFENILDSLPT